MRASGRRSAFWVALACASVPMLVAGCGDSGFRPLYASSSITGSTSASEKLAKMEVAPIPGRVGQRVRNELIFQATGTGNEAYQPAYRLEIVLKKSISATLVQIDGNSSGSVYNLNASFRLIRLDDKSIALQGQSYGRIALPALQFGLLQRACAQRGGRPGRENRGRGSEVAACGLSVRRRLSRTTIAR